MTRGFAKAGEVTLLAALAAAGIPHAATTPVRVTANVLPRVHVTMLAGPTELHISEDDARRGFLEASGSSFDIRANCPYRLEIRLAPGPVTGAQARLAGHSVAIGEGGHASVEMPMSRRGSAATVLYRFVIAPGTPPGTYAWPARLVVQPMGH